MSYLLYSGPSMLDGNPVVAIVTGIDKLSANAKTGPMAQIWYLRADMNPTDAVHSGADRAICGDCPARGDGTGKGRYCYVSLFRGVLEVYKSWADGRVKPLPPHETFWAGHRVRFGAYGDPACVPAELTERIARDSLQSTGYTHSWRTCDPKLSQFVMASVESEAEKREANAMGWATYRMKRGDEPRLPGEADCPASVEAGKTLTCYYCGRCAGAGSRDTVINVHGNGRKHFNIKHLNHLKQEKTWATS